MILVTGFGPYQEDTNASGELVNSIKSDIPDELLSLERDLVFEVLNCDDTSRETEHTSLEAQLLGLLKRYKPELCIYTGQAPRRNKLTIEKIARNSFMRQAIDSSRPAAYCSDLPGNDSLKDILEEENIPTEYSFNGGQHLCNHILYSSLFFSEKYRLPHKSGFIHFPLLPEQVSKHYPGSPYMPIEMSRNALSLIINHVAANK